MGPAEFLALSGPEGPLVISLEMARFTAAQDSTEDLDGQSVKRRAAWY